MQIFSMNFSAGFQTMAGIGICALIIFLMAPRDTEHYPNPRALHKSMSDLELWLEDKRLLINFTLEYDNYNLTEKNIPELGGIPRVCIIIGRGPFGASYINTALLQLPVAHGQYEPLAYGLQWPQAEGTQNESAKWEHIRNLLHCNYSDGMTRQHLQTQKSQQVFWTTDPELLHQFCALFPLQVMKISNLTLNEQLLESLLEDAQLDVRVLLLVRDPRGIAFSCQQHALQLQCDATELCCSKMRTDHVWAQHLLAKYSERFLVLRYEEVFSNAKRELLRILDFFGLPYTLEVALYIRKHARKFAPAFDWLSYWDAASALQAQRSNHCLSALRLWGYRKLPSTAAYGQKFEPLLPTPFKPIVK